MTTKEYLQQIFTIRQKISRLNSRRDEIRREMYAMKSPAGKMSADKVQSSTTGDQILKLIASVDSIERDIVEEIQILERMRDRISREIEAVPDDRYKRLLHQRYELCWRWEKIAADWGADGISVRHIYRLHGDALKAFAKVLKK